MSINHPSGCRKCAICNCRCCINKRTKCSHVKKQLALVDTRNGTANRHLLILVRHGLSQGEIDKRYDGWNDPDLSQLGTNQARRAGAALHQAGFPVDLCYTSVLKRASKSLFLILDEMDLLWLQVHTTWRLNDRMIGALTGFQQDRADSLFGQSQLKEWLTRAQNAPPALEESNPNHPRSDPKYRNISNVVPSTETLVDVQKRILPLWYDEISQNLNMGKNILVVAHEETLKAIIRFINNYMTDEFSQNELPVCIPIIFEFSSETQEIVNGYYLISSLLDQVNSYQSKLFPSRFEQNIFPTFSDVCYFMS